MKKDCLHSMTVLLCLSQYTVNTDNHITKGFLNIFVLIYLNILMSLIHVTHVTLKYVKLYKTDSVTCPFLHVNCMVSYT